MSDDPVELNLEELKELIKLLRESNVSEFEFRKADYRLRIKHGTILEGALTQPPGLNAIPADGRPNSSSTEVPALSASSEQVAEEKLHEVRSPMVGTFYLSATPGAAPFVEIGDIIRKGEVLCIIEAMKIMNEIESDVDGEVRKIHIANGQPIEYGELLYSIKPVA